MNKRTCLRLCLALGLLSTSAAFAQSQGVLTMVVPYPAGGASDVFARSISPELGRQLNRTIVIENISGASGSIAANKVLGARTGGEMLFMASPTEVILAPAVLKAVKYKAEDFKLLGLIDKAPLTLFVRASLPVNTIDELVAYAKQPGAKPLTYGTTGPGSVYHLATEGMRRAAGLEMTHVPYRGGAPLLQDLIAGNIDMTLLPASGTISGMAETGKIRAIAVAGNSRSLRFPKVATIRESKALPDFTAPDMWAGVMVPATTPQPLQDQLHAALARTLALPELRTAVEAVSAAPVPAGLSLPQAAAFYQAQSDALRAAAKAANVDPN